MKFYMPENLDLDQLIKENPPNNIKNFKKENLIYIISLISEIPANLEHFDSNTGYVPINSRKLKMHVKNYKDYINYLIEAGVIETDNRYIVGAKSKGYRFSEKYMKRVETVEIVYYTLEKSLNKIPKIQERARLEYSFLTKWYNDNLNIDFSAAKKQLDDDFKNNTSITGIDLFRRYNSSFININRFKNHHYFIIVDDTVNRLHSNLTNLKSEFRNFINYDGKKLVAIDIKNSQPYLSTILLNPNFYSTESSTTLNISSINTYYTNFTSTLPFSSYHPLLSPPPMWVKSLQEKDNQDVNLFKNLVKNGELYEYFGAEIEREFGINNISRDNVKKIIFTIYFTSNRFIGQPEARYKKVFKRLFPTVYTVFSFIKRNNKTLLAHLLQRIESYLVLEVICKRIAKERSDLVIYTIHDSIVTTAGDEHYVYKVMEEELTKHIGISPTLKYEYWTSTWT